MKAQGRRLVLLVVEMLLNLRCCVALSSLRLGWLEWFPVREHSKDNPQHFGHTSHHSRFFVLPVRYQTLKKALS